MLEEAETVAASIPQDYSALSEDVTDLKSEIGDTAMGTTATTVTGAIAEHEEDISGINTALAGKQAMLTFDNVPTSGSNNPVKSGGVYAAEALKVNKPTTSPNGTNGQYLKTNGDGTTAWDDPLEEPVTDAVADWLEAHPEATTTVQDGSLTEEKFTTATLRKVANDYVTPQMYGAVGDGTTDDTSAIQAAFDSGHNVLFPNGTYLIDGATVNSTICIKSDSATLKVRTSYQDHVLEINATVYTSGMLYINGDYKALCGIKFENSYNSYVEMLNVQKCSVWGVRIAVGSHSTFGYIYTNACGSAIQATVSYASKNTITVDSILSNGNKTILSSAYTADGFPLEDASGYAETKYATDPFSGSVCFRITGYNADTNVITSSSNFQSDYISKACYIICGGGVFIGNNVFSQINFGIVDTRLGGTGMTINATYGHVIQAFYSQSDRIPMYFGSYSLGCTIGSFTTEGSKSGYKIYTQGSYNYSVIVATSTGYNNNFMSSEVSTVQSRSYPLYNPILLKTMVRRTIPYYYNAGVTAVINEAWPDNTFFLYSKTGFQLSLSDGFMSEKTYNPWGVKTVYFLPSNNPSTNITVSLTDALVNNGYSIYGGENGAITFSRPSQWFKVEVFLRRESKQFALVVTPINRITST